ncbi:hypothetical protein C8J57DRAFT_1540743 [Mycena rebaudengoi]|nr:hypothetical protein C8J57DRAFT_1540743 [Mycena rebaudengoi]
MASLLHLVLRPLLRHPARLLNLAIRPYAINRSTETWTDCPCYGYLWNRAWFGAAQFVQETKVFANGEGIQPGYQRPTESILGVVLGDICGPDLMNMPPRNPNLMISATLPLALDPHVICARLTLGVPASSSPLKEPTSDARPTPKSVEPAPLSAHSSVPVHEQKGLSKADKSGLAAVQDSLRLNNGGIPSAAADSTLAISPQAPVIPDAGPPLGPRAWLPQTDAEWLRQNRRLPQHARVCRSHL